MRDRETERDRGSGCVIKGRKRTHHAGNHGERKQTDRRRQNMHTTHNRRVPLHSLEIHGKVVLSRKDSAKKEEKRRSSRPDNLCLKHSHWNHGCVSLAPLPDKEEDEHDAAADKETDNHGTVPGV